MTDQLNPILQTLGLPPSSQKIYRDLLEHGESTAKMLSLKLSITRPSAYDHLDLLIKKGFIVEKKKDNKTYFAAADVRHIEHILDSTIEKLEEQKNTFTSMLPSLLKQSSGATPVVKFYEGKEGIEVMLYDTLWSKGETIYTMWPHEEIEKVLGKEFLVSFNNKRIRGKIEVCALWPKAMKPKSSFIWKDKDTLIKRRYAPNKLVWSMGYTIYGDKVSFISSSKEIFGFVVQSREFAELMKLQFDVLWCGSKEK